MLEPLRFLLSDDIHIHARSFASLFGFIKRAQVPVVVHKEHAPLKRALGLYRDRTELQSYVASLRSLAPDALFTHCHRYGNTPLELFPLYRSELLAYLLAADASWHSEEPPDHDHPLFTRLYRDHHELLIHNAAAAMFWIDQLAPYFGPLHGGFSHAFVFGGSAIYTRVVMEMCRRSETRCMVLESSFTGHQYYLQERYTPLCDTPDIQLPTIRTAHAKRVSLSQPALHAHVAQLMFSAKNKNVVQPDEAVHIHFSEPARPELLIIGQVANDFSIVEQRGCPRSTVAFYRQLITRSLRETDFNIVFKAHPWEKRKQHIERTFTLDVLRELKGDLSAAHQQRLHLTDEANLFALGKRAQRVALLSSQAGLELAFHCGLRPSTFGRPFYEAAGFSDDFADIDAFIAHVQANGARALLDLPSYDALLAFLGTLLIGHCISDGPDGVAQIAARLPRTPSDQSKRRQSDNPLDRLRAKSRKLLTNPRRFVRDSRLLQRWIRG